MLRSNLIMTALSPLENLGFFIFYAFFFPLKSEICKTEETRFAEYSHFCCNLYYFPAIMREGPKMWSFHLNYSLHFTRGGSRPPGTNLLQAEPKPWSNTTHRHQSKGLEGKRNICISCPCADPAFLTQEETKGKESLGLLNATSHLPQKLNFNACCDAEQVQPQAPDLDSGLI